MEQIRKKSRKYNKKRRIRLLVKKMLYLAIGMMVISGLIVLVKFIVKPKIVKNPPDYAVDLLTINEYSRPGDATSKINGIVIHYTANPGTTAAQNRSYFEGLKDSKITKASSHFIIGLEGEIIQCIPTSEIAYASNDRNNDTVSIECCHMDETGEFNEETYQSLVHLTAWLCGKFDLRPKDVIRHYDVTGKLCPKYYVEHEDKWEQFIEDVKEYIDTYGVKEWM